MIHHKKQKRIIQRLAKALIFHSLFFIFHFFSSCIVEREIPITPEEKKTELQLRVQVPSLSLPQTRSLTEAQESRIETLDLLVFEVDGAVEKYAYHTRALKIENENNDPSQYLFAVSLQASREDEQYRIVLLANLEDEIEAATLVKDASKESTLENILISPAERWGDDKVAGTSSLLPMWGESTGTHKIDYNITTSTIGTIPLLRSVARINIGVNMPAGSDTPQGLGDTFYIEDIQILGANRTALPAPAAANLTGGTVTVPTLPSGGSTGTITYTHTPADAGFINEIYIGETSIASQPTILIGAYYTAPDADVKNETKKTWYKLILYDYNETDPFSNPLNILRNHYYRINITAVNNPGYTTAAEALKNPSTDLIISLHVYDEAGDIHYVKYNNHYMIGVSDEVIRYEWDETIGEIAVLTDYQDGWSFEITDSKEEGGNPVDWITNISRTTNQPGVKDFITLEMEEGWGIRKYAYLHLKAGNLEQTVRIVQKGLPNSYMLKPGETLEFPIRKAYGVWAHEVMGDQQQTISGAVEFEFIWQDAQSLLTSYGLKSDQAHHSWIQVTAGSGTGNVLIGVKIGGTRRYSWHIWVTDYDPETNTNGSTYPHNNGQRDYLFMDRNLGATTTTPATITTHGLHYQWGRKDPFPGPNGIYFADGSAGLHAHKPLYTESNGSKTITYTSVPATTASTSSNNLHNTFIYPDHSYWANPSLTQDWYTTQGGTTGVYQNNYLWSYEDGDKGIFDPCPEGWRIPTVENGISPWAIDSNNNLWNPSGGNTWNYGMTFNTVNWGYYPAVGHRVSNGNFFSGIGVRGYCWTSTPPDNYNVIAPKITQTSFESATTTYRVVSVSVRCVKE